MVKCIFAIAIPIKLVKLINNSLQKLIFFFDQLVVIRKKFIYLFIIMAITLKIELV